MRYLISTIFLLLSSLGALSQGTIKGVISHDDGGENPLVNAVVIILDTDYKTLTDEKGAYIFENVPNGTYILGLPDVNFGIEQKKIKVKDDVVVQNFTAIPALISILPYFPPVYMEPAIVDVYSAAKDGAMAYTDVSADEIEKLNNGQDLPLLLRFQPSVVTTSDAGAGVGYTGLRIRGSDASRINVTINGIPYNDSESQGVFWVNMPDLASSVDKVQIQRGVGTSTNGSGAFGGTIGVNTLNVDREAYAQINNSIGSFNTFKHTVAFGTGLLDDVWAFEGRLSQITSDGFIDRASSDLKSYYVAGSWNPGQTLIRAVAFGGQERTYQSWYGTPESRLFGTEEDMLIHASNNGLSESQTENLLNSGRTYNFYEYEDEVDNYAQDHYQLHISQYLRSKWKFSVAGHYTYGRGYFEQFRGGDDFSDYGFDSQLLGAVQQFSDGTDDEGNPINNSFESLYEVNDIEFNHDAVLDGEGDPILDDAGNTLVNSSASIASGDFIRRRWLENDFYGTTYSVEFIDDKFKAIFGGAWNQYDGDHFGELIWSEHNFDWGKDHQYYLNNGFKTDWSNYLKLGTTVKGNLTFFVDLQLRNVTYETKGIDNDLRYIDTGDTLSFFNPKAGLTYRINENNQLYASIAKGSREPTRSDYIDAVDTKPLAETMIDIEAGYRWNSEKLRANVNVFNMMYDNQLVPTGELNDVGSPVRENVAESFRRGVELELIAQPTKAFFVGGNLTLSENKILDYTDILYDYTTGFDIIEEVYSETDIAFSPDLVAAFQAGYTLFDKEHQMLELGWNTKYVGDQFLDNTSNVDRSINAYLLNDLRVSYTIKNCCFKQATFNFLVNNILDEVYESNGYTFSYVVGDVITENFYYPQAGRNYSLALNLLF